MSNKRGPKEWLPTDEVLEKIKDLAKRQLNKSQIAPLVGLHPSTFSEKMSVYPEISEAFEWGRTEGLAHIANRGYELCLKGNSDMVKFFLKSKGEFKENDPVIAQVQPIVVTVDGKKITMGIE